MRKLLDRLKSESRALVEIEVNEDGVWYPTGPTDGETIIDRSELPDSACSSPPSQDYWQSAHVHPKLEKIGWKTFYTHYDSTSATVIFCKVGLDDGSLAVMQRDDERKSDSRDASARTPIRLQALLAELSDLGSIRGVTVTTHLEDGTKIAVDLQPATLERTVGQPARPRGFSINPGTKVSAPAWIGEEPRVTLPEDVDSHAAYLREAKKHLRGLTDRPGLGGHGCLATMSRRKSEAGDSKAIYRPDLLGLRTVDEPNSLYGFVANRRLVIVHIVGKGHDNSNSIRVRVRNDGERLRVLIPIGTVFEQKGEPERVQDLVTKELVDVVVETGQHDIAAHGLCMYEDLKSPDGEEMLLTPWQYELTSDLGARDDAQQVLWARAAE